MKRTDLNGHKPIFSTFVLSTSSQTSSRAIIEYLCLHHSCVILKSPPELLRESRQTFPNCADLSSPHSAPALLPWDKDEWWSSSLSVTLAAINHSKMKLIATSAPRLWELRGFVQAPGRELCSFSWDQLFNPDLCRQFEESC